jgi:hypothetical protein
MSLTVIPLHNLDLPDCPPIMFGGGFVLDAIPEWLRRDDWLLNRFSAQDREAVLQAKHALIAEYPATTIGENDPGYQGRKPRSIQGSKTEAAGMANLALWIIQPSMACFTSVFHALSWLDPDSNKQIPIIQQTTSRQALFCHPNDETQVVSRSQAEAAGKLSQTMVSISPDSTVWVALRYVYAALTTYARDLRHPMFWIALEAMFGPDQDSGEIAYKLCQRIAFLISTDPVGAKETFRKAKAGYAARSKIVHGRWKESPKMLETMAATETIVRTARHRILSDIDLVREFSSDNRDVFLEDLIFASVGR